MKREPNAREQLRQIVRDLKREPHGTTLLDLARKRRKVHPPKGCRHDCRRCYWICKARE